MQLAERAIAQRLTLFDEGITHLEKATGKSPLPFARSLASLNQQHLEARIVDGEQGAVDRDRGAGVLLVPLLRLDGLGLRRLALGHRCRGCSSAPKGKCVWLAAKTAEERLAWYIMRAGESIALVAARAKLRAAIRSPSTMQLDHVVLVPKLTGVEYDMHRFNLTLDEMPEHYRRGRLDPDRILDSHHRQKENLERVVALFDELTLVPRNALSREATRGADVVVSLGGDNHLTYVAHYTDDAPIVGLNSDPRSSAGVLLHFSCGDLDALMEKLTQGTVTEELWPRIAIKLNDKEVESAVTECFFGEHEPFFASYNFLKINERRTTHRGSGTLVTNGAGSTGWYTTASQYCGGEAFGRSERRLRFLSREPFMDERYNDLVCGGCGSR